MKLISMVDYILQIDEIEPKAVNFSSITDIKNHQLNSYSKIINYANFLKQPLELWMFIPCDEKGNVLEEKSIFNTTDDDYIFNSDAFDKYQQAKDRVLFDGFSIYGNGDLYNDFVTFESTRLESMTIESLITDFQYSFYLTPNAIKQL